MWQWLGSKKKELGNRSSEGRIMNWYKADVVKQKDNKEQLPPPYAGGNPCTDILKTKVEHSQERTQTKIYRPLFFQYLPVFLQGRPVQRRGNSSNYNYRALSNLISLKMSLLIAGSLDEMTFKVPFQHKQSYNSTVPFITWTKYLRPA